ncbi:alpha-aminoadipic semialdehyde synthase isoform X1 [Brassica napus]|uniref:alpha-aminoadipic semialdehyde synthase isoform X1 n=2 Tax=Brassica napus TaxID=3708 RepID=UPI0020790203|nr:alpha-aminoadipic semialdehyde synthase isoform X1 [Brassica napus]XP_013735143.2 alpha-aminoadipic semialdehyde synthase isoform X1 [Brassica napus]XP_013735144.2 alpha-aminoadipic semialdehyde synthase isoform X1 [Brassica napus]XP_013735146.2 alpha-aminoadipic semialdehyde synthase isoform X1 [Brassica napus]
MNSNGGDKEKKKKLGNGVVGILAETVNKWERRTPLTPSHCARLLHGGKDRTGVSRIVVQPSAKRIHHDALYEDVGCEVSDDLSDCGLILGIKQPELEMILPERAYAFFSHTHKAQKENMPLLDKILSERVTLYDYELIVGDHGKRLLAFGQYAGRAGLVDFLHGLGQRYLSLGYSTPFLSLGSSYMYSSLAAAKAAVISVGEEIASQGLPLGICPLVFVFTGTGNVSLGAQEIFKLLPHTFVEPSKLPELFVRDKGVSQNGKSTKRVHHVYGCISTSQDMVEHQDPSNSFDKADYYVHPEHYNPVFHEKIAPYTSVLVNCMYWEKRFPRLLSTKQLQDLTAKGCPLVGICDITCDIGGSIEFVNRATLIDSPFFRFNPMNNSYYQDMDGNGLLCMAVDILPTEFAKEASQHFGDILSEFVGSLASMTEIENLPTHLKRACISYRGELTSLYEYIPRMRKSDPDRETQDNITNGASNQRTYNILVSLSGHLFDKFLINEALDMIEAAGGSFHLAKCEIGQSADAESYSELEVGADDRKVLDQIIDSLTRLANPDDEEDYIISPRKETNKISLKIGKVQQENEEKPEEMTKRSAVLILGAGRVCRPAAEFLASVRNISSQQWYKTYLGGEQRDVHVIVASLYLKDAKETVEGMSEVEAVQLDVSDNESLLKYVSEVDVVLSLLPASCHAAVAKTCIELKKHLITASYVDDETSMLHEKAKSAGITILGEMGLDPGIDHMMAMKMINEAHIRKGKVKSFTSYCGGLPSPAAANNPLAYKFSWNPAGAIRAGRNPAKYKSNGDTIHVDGEDLYDSATRFRVPNLPAFALECLPNRNSLVYGEHYGIESEASTIFRGTLRYEGFSMIMSTLSKLGFFDNEANQLLSSGKSITFGALLSNVLVKDAEALDGEEEISKRIIKLGHSKESADKAAKTIVFLGYHEEREIPSLCKSVFDATCYLMEEKLAYSGNEQDMVLLHHEVEVEFPESKRTEKHSATLLEFGEIKNGQMTTAMAKTVGIPAAIGALLLIEDKIKTRGVLRPLEPEVYLPALDILQAYGIKLMEKTE